ncbi:MAG: hypothetical protein J0M34_08380 [Alphaproteobacteria bacterium]|nr:hypothetical protein [Alphaproteobacteria bacterium]
MRVLLILLLGITILSSIYYLEPQKLGKHNNSTVQTITNHNNVQYRARNICLQVTFESKPELITAEIKGVKLEAYQGGKADRTPYVLHSALYSMHLAEPDAAQGLEDTASGELTGFGGKLVYKKRTEIMGLSAIESQVIAKHQDKTFLRTTLNLILGNQPITISMMEPDKSASKSSVEKLRGYLSKC